MCQSHSTTKFLYFGHLQGYWMVKRAVGTKACLLGKAVTCNYLRKDNYLEVFQSIVFLCTIQFPRVGANFTFSFSVHSRSRDLQLRSLPTCFWSIRASLTHWIILISDWRGYWIVISRSECRGASSGLCNKCRRGPCDSYWGIPTLPTPCNVALNPLCFLLFCLNIVTKCFRRLLSISRGINWPLHIIVKNYTISYLTQLRTTGLHIL